MLSVFPKFTCSSVQWDLGGLVENLSGPAHTWQVSDKGWLNVVSLFYTGKDPVTTWGTQCLKSA